MPANPTHHSATVDEPWDGPAEEARLATPITKTVGNGMYAWHDANGADPDGDGYPDAKADSKFPHHVVTDGKPGPANVNGCQNGIDRLPDANVPDGDRAAVEAHLQAHIDDEEGDETPEPDDMGPGMGKGKGGLVRAPHSYAHIAKAVFERPWAMQPSMLSLIGSLLQGRVAGVVLSEAEIETRLAAAQAQNGPRNGGGTVNGVCVIPMYGMLSDRQSLMGATSGGTSIDDLRSDLHDALGDPSISSIVFDIDSPGGSVDGVTEFAAELRKVRGGSKPIVAQVDTLCASAAYWLAAQMTEIVVTPSGCVGSIGIFAMHEDASKADEMAGIQTTFISAGKYKVDGMQGTPLTDTARAAIQDDVDTFYGMFVGDVAAGRRIAAADVEGNYGQGRPVLAKKALAAGMVDRIDTIDATVSRLMQATRATKGGRAALSVVPGKAALAATSQARRITSHSGRPGQSADRLLRAYKETRR